MEGIEYPSYSDTDEVRREREGGGREGEGKRERDSFISSVVSAQ